MPELEFARAVGLVLAIPILLVLLVGLRANRPRRRKSLRDRFSAANPGCSTRGERP